MKKQILLPILYAVSLFIFLAALKFSSGMDAWLDDTLEWVIAVLVGYFIGYKNLLRIKKD